MERMGVCRELPRHRPGAPRGDRRRAGRYLLWLCCLAAILPAVACAADGDHPKPTVEAPVAPAAPARMAIADAIDGLADLDEPTRQNCLARLRAADENDIPDLEKFAQSHDPEVRQQVTLILKKLKRGELVFSLAYPNGTPIADAKVNIRVYMADEVQVMNTGMSGQFLIYYKPPRQGAAKEELQVEVAADKDGRVSAGRMNDGKYLVLVDAPDSLPRQISQSTIELREKTEPRKITFKRGCNVTVTVVDPDGKPVANATVANCEQSNLINTLQAVPPGQAQNYLRQMITATTDEKGVAVLEHIGLGTIQPVVIAEGFQVAVADKMEVADGGVGQTTIKMVKVRPVAFTLVLKNAQTNKSMANARVLLIPTQKVAAVVGQMWYTQTNSDSIDDYIKNGATDLATTNEKGEISFSAVPDAYQIFAFTGKSVSWMQISLNAGNAKNQLRMNSLNR